LEQEAGWQRWKTNLIKTAILCFGDMNLERCREKLEREVKHAMAGIFGGRSWSANFGGCLGVLLRRSGLREHVMKRGGSGRWQGFFFFGRLGDGERQCRSW
jgi:hypothetical protein